MANQIPLIVNAGAAQIQELATADNLEISANIVTGGILTDGYYYANGTPVTFGGGNVDLTQVTTDIIPVGNNTQSLGNATNQWQDIYVSNATIYFDSVPLTVDGSGQLTFDSNLIVQTGPNVVNTGTLETTGNIIGANVEANFFFGDGSNLTGIASGVSVSQWATGNALSNTVSNVENIWFDSTTGFNVTNITGNTALISLGSSFKTWEVAGQANLVAVGEDTVKFVAGNNIVITTNANVIPQQIEFAVSSNITATSVSVTGNVTGNYFIGDGSQLTNLPVQPGTYDNSNVATFLADFGSNTINTTGNISVGNVTLTNLYSPNFYANAITYANANGFLTNTNVFKYNPDTEVLTVGSVSTTGNVTANIFNLANAGNLTYSSVRQNQNPPYGSEAYGIELLTTTDDANVFSSVAAGPDYVSLKSTNAGNANVVVQGGYGVTISTSNATGGAIKNWTFTSAGNALFPGALSTALDISTTGNVFSQGIVSAVGNIVTDGYFVGTFIGNVTGNFVVPGANTQVIFNTNGNADATGGMTFDKGPNLFTVLGTVSAQGNVISGNVLTSNIVSAGGNVTGNYFIGNGSALTGIVSTYSNTNVQSYLQVLTSNISTTGNIQAAGNITAGNYSTAGNILGAGNFSVTGNAIASNFDTAGNILGSGNFSVTGNAIAGNFTSAGNVSASGNVTGNYFIGDGSQLTNLPSGANIGNVTFDNINIIGTGNLHLQPDPANTGSYLDIFLTSGPDLHLVASANANLILGKDNQSNVRTSWDGNVTVQSWNSNTGTAGGTWTFDGTGNLTLPGNTSSINYANGQPYGGSSAAAGNAGDIQINVAGNIGADSTLRYVDNGGEMTLYADYLNAPGIFTSDIYAGDGTPSNITLTTSYGNATWTFGLDGNLTIPGAILTNSNSQLQMTETANTAYLGTTADDSTALYLTATTAQLYANGEVSISSNVGGGNTYGWAFDVYGNTNIPGNIVSSGNIAITANVGGTLKSWTFDNAGNLTTPQGGYIGAAGVKGDGTMLTGGTGNIASLTSFYADAPGIYAGCFTANPDGTLNITTYGNGTGALGVWNYANTTLYVPGNGSITTNNAVSAAGGNNVTVQAGASDQNNFNANPGGNLNLTGGLGGFNDDGVGGPGGNINITAGSPGEPGGAAGNVNITAGVNSWTFNNAGNLSLATVNNESAAFIGSRKLIGGLSLTSPYSITMNVGGTPTVAYTALTGTQSVKVTFVIESSGSAFQWEQFDVIAVPSQDVGGDVNFVVSNRVKGAVGVPDTAVTATMSGSQIQISLTLDVAQTNGGTASYDATEFGLMVD